MPTHISCTHGRIINTDIQHVLLDLLHDQVSLIPQEPSLFHRSLKENIVYGRLETDNEAIQAAARLVHADALIRVMPEGYDSVVDERSVKLSCGQRQRIAIAHRLSAIAHMEQILVFDQGRIVEDGGHNQLLAQQVFIVVCGPYRQAISCLKSWEVKISNTN